MKSYITNFTIFRYFFRIPTSVQLFERLFISTIGFHARWTGMTNFALIRRWSR